MRHWGRGIITLLEAKASHGPSLNIDIRDVSAQIHNLSLEGLPLEEASREGGGTGLGDLEVWIMVSNFPSRSVLSGLSSNRPPRLPTSHPPGPILLPVDQTLIEGLLQACTV